MKKLLFLTILVCFISCKKDEQEKFFDPGDIGLLNLETIETFWDDDAIMDTSGVGILNTYPGFMEGYSYLGKVKSVWILVYETQAMAIGAIEMLRNNVECVILDGTSDAVKGKWWFSDCIPNIVIVNQWNTIIEVSYYHADFEKIENTLYSTANELAERVDNLSE